MKYSFCRQVERIRSRTRELEGEMASCTFKQLKIAANTCFYQRAAFALWGGYEERMVRAAAARSVLYNNFNTALREDSLD